MILMTQGGVQNLGKPDDVILERSLSILSLSQPVSALLSLAQLSGSLFPCIFSTFSGKELQIALSYVKLFCTSMTEYESMLHIVI